MKLHLGQRFLTVYAGVLTLVFAGTVLMGATSTTSSASFDQITVHRINLVEPDGTLRMVISDHAKFPGLFLHGKEYPHPRPQAGMLFYNDEGTEQGGLVFAGAKNKGGYSSGLSLTFDRYNQDQQLQLIGLDENNKTYAGLEVNDVPHTPILQSMAELEKVEATPKGSQRTQAEAQWQKQYGITRRYFAGKSGSGNSVVMLRDANGKPRLALTVTPAGKASIDFLDANGKVQRTLTATDAAKP